jgi:hypothetical protein
MMKPWKGDPRIKTAEKSRDDDCGESVLITYFFARLAREAREVNESQNADGGSEATLIP